MKIDEAGSISGPAQGRARAAALAELRRQPVAVSWRWEAMRTVLAVLGTTALVEPGRLGERLPQVALLVALQSLGVFAAIAPGRSALRLTAALIGAVAVAAILFGRGPGLPRAMPAIACSGSHLAVDLIPLSLVLYSLRRFSWSLGRAALAGAAVAATGALAGELSCQRGWMHALVHHVGAGLVIVAACVLISRTLRPHTYAP
jgi:hypothetical protein